MVIREFKPTDSARLVEILERNGQYDFPEVEGPNAMQRFSECESTIFLVAVINEKLCGLIRAIYDGSRAYIHLLSVDPDVQRKGIGTRLVREAEKRLAQMGAPSAAVTVGEQSPGFWENLGYLQLPVRLHLKEKLGK